MRLDKLFSLFDTLKSSKRKELYSKLGQTEIKGNKLNATEENQIKLQLQQLVTEGKISAEDVVFEIITQYQDLYLLSREIFGDLSGQYNENNAEKLISYEKQISELNAQVVKLTREVEQSVEQANQMLGNMSHFDDTVARSRPTTPPKDTILINALPMSLQAIPVSANELKSFQTRLQLVEEAIAQLNQNFANMTYADSRQATQATPVKDATLSIFQTVFARTTPTTQSPGSYDKTLSTHSNSKLIAATAALGDVLKGSDEEDVSNKEIKDPNCRTSLSPGRRR